jgi:ABC-type lipoprotein export system ATPase subunit
MQTISEAAAYTYNLLIKRNDRFFLTGKAGTGKTTLLEIIATTHKKHCCSGTYGNSSFNAGGVTIHRCFSCLLVIHSFL